MAGRVSRRRDRWRWLRRLVDPPAAEQRQVGFGEVIRLAGGDVKLVGVVAIASCLLTGPGCGGSKSAAATEDSQLCTAVAELRRGATEANADAAETYRSAATDIDAVAKKSPGATPAEVGARSRLRAVSSQARVALIEAKAGNDDQRRAAESKLNELLAKVPDCP
jgi:hypothetical protein